MKYSQKNLATIEAYSKKLNLPPALVHIARTEYQADMLNQAILDCLSWSDFYTISKYNDLNDPTREYNEALKAKKTLEEYLERTDINQMWLLNKIQIPDNRTRNKPSKTITTFQMMIHEKLIDADFSITTIKKEIMPILRTYIKDDSLI